MEECGEFKKGFRIRGKVRKVRKISIDMEFGVSQLSILYIRKEEKNGDSIIL